MDMLRNSLQSAGLAVVLGCSSTTVTSNSPDSGGEGDGDASKAGAATVSSGGHAGTSAQGTSQVAGAGTSSVGGTGIGGTTVSVAQGGISAAGSSGLGVAGIAGALTVSPSGGRGLGGATNASGAGGIAAGGLAGGGAVNAGGTTGGQLQGGQAGTLVAGAAGTSTIPALSITTNTLPDGAYNVIYSIKLETSGGTRQAIAFSLTGGTLPTGLTLAADGTLSGRPTSSGSFSITISVKDSSGAVAQHVYSLLVQRKRWIAYATDELRAGIYLPYVIDRALGTYPRTEIFDTALASTTCGGIARMQFSPDGKRLFYTAEMGESCNRYGLYVVDTSGDSVGSPSRVDRNTGLDSPEFIISQDSRFCAYTESVDTGAGASQSLIVVDIAASAPKTPVEVASSTNMIGMCWAGSRLAWLDGGVLPGIYTVTLVGSTWQGPAAAKQATGLSINRCTAGGKIWSTGSDWVVIDLETLSTSASYPRSSLSYDLSFVDYAFSPRAVYRVGPQLDAPLLTLTSAAVWANRTNRFVFGGGSLGNPRFVDLTPAPITNVELATAPSNAQISFSPNDARMAFSSTTAISVANVTASGVGAISTATAPLGNGGTLEPSSVQFSPDSEAIAYLAEHDTVGLKELYLVSATSPATTAPRKLNSTLPSNTSIAGVVWTSDSAALIYDTGAVNLVEVVSPTATARRIISGNYKELVLQP